MAECRGIWIHDTELSGIVQTAAHAVAVDEHRIDYQATLWSAIPKPGQSVEQRWFLGAHADVGGGYDSRLLSDLALAWMQHKAMAAGLAIDPGAGPALAVDNYRGPIHDSYRDFLNGVYAKTHPEYFRSIDLSAGSTQTIDASVLARKAIDTDYMPRNAGFPVVEPPIG
jgi:hypothetical protein